MNLKDKIRQYRLDNNLTQESLAKTLYVSRSSVAKWEQGRSIPSLEILNKFAQISNTTIDDLINEHELKTITFNNTDKIKKNNFLIKIVMTLVGIAIVSTIVFSSIILLKLYLRKR